ncbi:hypothetical protein ACM257_17645 [Alteromonas macleodii]|uniref:hypothetical protein n=1 Tax=Alteromonas macleodii TaxID=28108 RepID=UPI0039F692F9
MSVPKVKLLRDGVNKPPHIKKMDGIYICIGIWVLEAGRSINPVGQGVTPKSAYLAWRQQVMCEYSKDYAA